MNNYRQHQMSIVAIISIAVMTCIAMFLIAKSNDEKMHLYDKMQKACNWVEDINGDIFCTTRENLE